MSELSIANRYRTHTCGALTSYSAGETVRVAGWVHRVRDHGGVLFVDLRDHYGITQVVMNPDAIDARLSGALRSEWVVSIEGTCRERPEGTRNPDLVTGEIEVVAKHVEILSMVDGDLPMPVFGDHEYPEEVRLKHRFLDLRREGLHDNILKRTRIVRWLRRQMDDLGFLDIQTPILTASSPEGARDFLVPSRLHPGKFYALPQAPQQFKQLLMVSGFDRYYQIAPCFRDEAARADRSPGEFYQLDIEMAFATQDDVFGVVEPLLRDLFRLFGEGKAVTDVFPRIPYREAMLRYGSDKPDLRNPLEIVDLTSILDSDGCTLAPFREAARTGVVRAIRVQSAALDGKSRKWFKDMEGWAIAQGAKGLGYLTLGPGRSTTGPLAKFFDNTVTQALIDATEAVPGKTREEGINPALEGDVIFFAAGPADVTVKFAGLLRTKLGEDLGMIDENRFAFCWIVDFPMFERNEETGAIEFSHNPFSMPQGGLTALDGDPLDVLAYQYDVVCNGVELSSGAIRNHRPDIMERAFALAGYDKATLEEKFGGMLSAFRCGAPPHGGIAPGVDRMVMLLCGATNLREVVAFPLNQKGEDLMMGAPSAVTPEQLRELQIRVTPKT